MRGCGGLAQVGKQFLLLLWKNFILQIRRPIGTAFEVALPILAVVLILVLQVLFSSEDRCFVTFPSDNLNIPTNIPGYQNPRNITITYNVFYTPNASSAASVAEILAEKLPLDTFNFEGFATEDEMVTNLQSRPANELSTCFRTGAGIVFEELDGNDMSYKIRLRHEVGSSDSWDTAVVSPRFGGQGPRIENNYLTEGFLQLQQLVAESIIQWKAGQNFEPIDVSVRQFPFPDYRVDFFLSSLSSILPIMLVMAFLYSAGVIVKELVLEKETRIRESMFMMGLKQWILWASWYVKQFLFLFISIFIISILLKARVFTSSDFFLILIFFTCFIFSMISFSFLVSVWFDSSRVGFIVGFVAWFVNYFPFLFLATRYDDLSLGEKVGSCFLSNTCLGLGVEVISQLERRGEGLLWTNAATDLSVDDNFSMIWVYFMLLLDSVVYMVIAWYVNAVKPGQYGVPRPFYFLFLPSYWCGVEIGSKPAGAITEAGIQVDPSAHEEVGAGLNAGIKIRDLTKIYSNNLFNRLLGYFFEQPPPKKAVDNLNLDMYNGQITALLGHNGAGKTTTMSMLTGLYTPSSGTAEISGFDIQTDMDQIRHSLGICPQHNVLFDRLTVSEHLAFFLRLKGIYDRQRVRKEVEDMIADLQLVGKSKLQSARLSGGMKRKLSVGIALIGGSEVVILDEPTSGMDPYARRATWDLLVKHKEGRTMLLTTHFMDEADILGDRIAIMADGRLCCSGSSLFLKSRYGVGYHMTVVKESSCVSEKVERLVRSFVPEAKQETDVGAELSFTLPSNATAKFPELFDELDSKKVDLGVASFGVSVTTMEEVFIKVGEDSGESLDNRLRRASSVKSPSSPVIGQSKSPPPPDAPVVVVNLDSAERAQAPEHTSSELATVRDPDGNENADLMKHSEHALSYNFEPNTGAVLWVQQFYAMFLKRFYNTLRFYGALVSQLVLPLLFVLFGLLVAVTVPNNQVDDAPRSLFLNNSGQIRDVTVFYAQFGGDLNLSTFRPMDVGEYMDRSMNVQALMNRTVPATSPEECCRYENQLLDKYCATRTAGELQQACGNDGGFGYSRCLNCLGCCRATGRAGSLPSCTNRQTTGTLFGSPIISNGAFCPSPPSLSVSETGSPSGILSSANTFVAENLLVQAGEDPVVFFRRYLAGFTITAPDPVYSLCNCQQEQSLADDDLGACMILDQLTPCVGDTNCTIYTEQADSCPMDTMSPLLCNRTVDSGCYAVNGHDFQAPTLQVQSCGVCNNSVSGVHPEQASSPAAATVWYNNDPFHAAPAALNAFHNIHLRYTTRNQSLSLTVINHPLPRDDDATLDAALNDPSGFGISTLVVFGYSFLLASFVLFLVNEKESKAKHLQFVSGVSPTSYWISSFAWDLINSLLPIIISIILFAAFQVDAYSGEALGAILVILLLTCWASIPLTYVFSFLFSNSLAAFGILMLVFYFSALFGGTIVLIVDLNTSTNTASDIVNYIFLLFPTYGLSSALNDLFLNQNVKSACQEIPEFCQGNPEARFVDNPLDVRRPGVGVTCIYLFLEGIFYFILTLFIQSKFFVPELKHLFGITKNGAVNPEGAVAEPLLHGEDGDVYAERKKVMTGATDENDVVIVKNLVKTYPAHLNGCTIRQPKTAVSGINLVIPSGECFGLLGVNGAGKTTTFSILTGEIPMSDGTAIIAGYDVRTSIKDVQQRVGYCPQFDALIERLTAYELLTMYARLRGIPEKQIKEVVETEIRRMDLTKHASKRCGTYSGGNKRKLSTAIALVGNPPIVMLDEPTTGMDPTTRRYLWDVLTKVVAEGRSIILTSHSMEECEALCTRLAIMVNGTFKCLGSTQHLKNKFGSGFTLQAKVKLSSAPPPEELPTRKPSLLRQRSSSTSKDPRRPSGAASSGPSAETIGLTEVTGPPSSTSTFNPYDTSQLHAFIKESFSGATLLEEHQGAVTYQLPSAGVTWSSVFRSLEGNRERLGIVDYSVSQTTLDQVFINFAKEQGDAE